MPRLCPFISRKSVMSACFVQLAASFGCQSEDEQARERSVTATEQAVTPKVPRLKTPWTDSVSTTNPLPEYPRPQMTRTQWQSLNGEWQFAAFKTGDTVPHNRNLAERVLVPFPIESPLSGIQRHEDRFWYRRNFTVPSAWSGKRVLLNFGAVDWKADVYVNGTLVGTHQGGYDAFSFDVTGALVAGTNEVILRVEDLTDAAAGQAVGKQTLNPSHIFYTPSSGIWQTVWLEPVPSARIARLDLTPNTSALNLVVQGTGISGQTVQVVVSSGGGQVASKIGSVGSTITLPIPNPHLWSPADPFLYDLTVQLRSGTTVVDQVGSYFGMRTIGLGSINGVLRPVLNGQFVFQLGTLDQGFWPDGNYTAPTDDALRFDLEEHKALGFNLIRKHIKVEPQRWYYWADKLGLLVWQDMPSMSGTPGTAQKQQFEAELRRLVDDHRSAPSIIMWVPFNEGWGQYDPNRIASVIKGWDPSRLVDNMSGVNGAPDGGNGDVVDWHQYVGPAAATPEATRASVLGEFGGLGFRVAGHEWMPGQGFGYEEMENAAILTDRFVGLTQATRTLIANPGLSAAVYTEITDVENEDNGILTYDRAVEKPDVNRVRNANSLVIAGAGPQGRLPLSTIRSFRVVTPGFTDRYMRHSDALGYTEVVNGQSTETLKFDASFRIVPGLADLSCYSFESLNYPGEYLRQSSRRIRKDPRDRSAEFDIDATFCARAALNGSSNVSLESKRMPNYFIRHRNAELWLDPTEDNALYRDDATWQLSNAWATYRIANGKDATLCLGVRGVDAHYPGSGVEVYNCSRPDDPLQDEQWYFVPTTNGYFRVVNSVSGLCLGVVGKDYHGPGAAAEVYLCSPVSDDKKQDEEWTWVTTANGRQLKNLSSSYCLGVVGVDRPFAGANAEVYYCGTDPNDQRLDETWSLQQ